MGIGIAVVVVVLAGAGWFTVVGMGPETFTGRVQPGGSGLVDRLFYGLFGKPRDVAKEQATLRWEDRPRAATRRRGFEGRGTSRRW